MIDKYHLPGSHNPGRLWQAPDATMDTASQTQGSVMLFDVNNRGVDIPEELQPRGFCFDKMHDGWFNTPRRLEFFHQRFGFHN